jgi:hypothetical protein
LGSLKTPIPEFLFKSPNEEAEEKRFIHEFERIKIHYDQLEINHLGHYPDPLMGKEAIKFILDNRIAVHAWIHSPLFTNFDNVARDLGALKLQLEGSNIISEGIRKEILLGIEELSMKPLLEFVLADCEARNDWNATLSLKNLLKPFGKDEVIPSIATFDSNSPISAAVAKRFTESIGRENLSTLFKIAEEETRTIKHRQLKSTIYSALEKATITDGERMRFVENLLLQGKEFYAHEDYSELFGARFQNDIKAFELKPFPSGSSEESQVLLEILAHYAVESGDYPVCKFNRVLIEKLSGLLPEDKRIEYLEMCKRENESFQKRHGVLRSPGELPFGGWCDQAMQREVIRQIPNRA